MESKIIDCLITEERFINTITVAYDDGSTEIIYKYYPDELYFIKDEFIGLTKKQAKVLTTQKDIAYLRS